MDMSNIPNFIPDMLVNDQAYEGQGLPPAQGAQGNPVFGVFTGQHSQNGTPNGHQAQGPQDNAQQPNPSAQL